ncbi:MAG: DNA-3-methyladenine glycosylase [Patescibacteria group bacterium]|nr:DNA-3-methyladenine glycosylase [Patescibacteria group bacterium]MDD5294612.1 DNA-3-methyladenine glycosylase [Patescibacteria group bacterium]MDD5555023.1 DNA-3-methyladenine glycosylase [Patescibacteria group bacterium]
MRILRKSFYNGNTLQVAQDLLGCFLVVLPGGKSRTTNAAHANSTKRVCKFKIVEVEAYNGPNDLASHASQGRTERNSIMFGKPGIIYVYFTYGMHYMLNIVTEAKDYPAAVLIRAVEPISHNVERIAHNTNGPAKLTKILGIDKFFNGLPIYTKKYGLWVEGGDEKFKNSQIKKATRIGVDYAGKYKDKKWRFYIKGNIFVSKK